MQKAPVIKLNNVRRFFSWVCFTLVVALAYQNNAVADDWPQWLGPKRDGIWREKGILEKFPESGPKQLWKTPIAGGYSGPVVGGGRVIVTDFVKAANALDPKSPFDDKTKIAGTERVLCLDEKNGKVLWKHEYDCPYQVSYAAGPRCSPVIEGDRVYTLGTMGHLFCFNLTSGKIIWSKLLPKDYNAPVPFWGFSGHPLIDGDNLICLVGGPGSLVVAFDKNNGKEVWKNLTVDKSGYAPPMIYEIGGMRQLIVWHPEGIHSLNPSDGKIHWFTKYPKNKDLKAALSIPTPRVDGRMLFVTAFYDGPLMLKLNEQGTKPQVLWQGKSRRELPEFTDGLHSIMATPFIKDGYIYGVGSYGELRCLNAQTGERLWSTRKPTSGGEAVRWANAFLVQHEEKCFLFNESGDLVIAHLSPKGYQEWSRANILPATNTMAGRNRKVLWSHPAFANQNIYARNDKHIVCVSLAAQ